jgi:hypothetical protein
MSTSTSSTTSCSSSPQKLIVEFQRRHGSAAAFYHLYSDVMERLRGSAVNIAADSFLPYCSRRPFVPLPIPRSFVCKHKEMSATESAEAVAPLVSFASSPLANVQQEGLSALARMSASADHKYVVNRGLIANSRGLITLVDRLQSPDPEIARSAAAVLSHVAGATRIAAESAVAAGSVPVLLNVCANSVRTGSTPKLNLLCHECAFALRTIARHDVGMRALAEQKEKLVALSRCVNKCVANTAQELVASIECALHSCSRY